MGEGVGNHPIKTALVYTNFLAAGAVYFVAAFLCFIPARYSLFMTAYNMAMANFIILPEFILAGGAMNGEHWLLRSDFLAHPVELLR